MMFVWFVCIGFTTSDNPEGYMGDLLKEKNIALDTDSLLKEIQTTSDIEIKWRAIRIIGMRKDLKGVKVLRGLLNPEEDPLTREEAAISLHMLGNKSGHSELVKLFEVEKNPLAKIRLAKNLASIFKDARGKDFVLEMAKSKVGVRRLYSVEALARILEVLIVDSEFERLLAFFVLFSKDDDPLIRREFVNASPVKKQFAKTLIPIFQKLSKNDPDHIVRKYAKSVLKFFLKSKSK